MLHLPKSHTPLLFMPRELKNYVIKEMVSASPYNRFDSGSFYNTNEKSWDYTPEGCIRVSDHWNFYSRGSYHCILLNPDNVDIAGKWVVAKYQSRGEYLLLEVFEKDDSEYTKRHQRRERFAYSFVEKAIKEKVRKENEKRLLKVWKRIEKRKKEERASLISSGCISVSFQVNDWSKGYKGRWVHNGFIEVSGILVHETKCTVSVQTGGGVKTYKAYSNYKECVINK